MSEKMENLVICGLSRTPFSFGNKLKEHGATQLLEFTFRGLMDRFGLKPEHVSAVITGAVQQDTKTPNMARIASLNAGFPEAATDFCVQGNCNSGFMGLSTAIGRILMNDGDLFVASGVESMSNFGYRLEDKSNTCGTLKEIEDKIKSNGMSIVENFKLYDCLMEGLYDSKNDIAMIEIAEIMANLYGISREEQDSYTLGNLKRAVEAVEGGSLRKYIVEVGGSTDDTYPLNRKRMLKQPQGFSRATYIFGDDNPTLNAEKFYQKHKRFLDTVGVKSIKATVTMYNSCIPGDGAGACIVTTEEKAKKFGLKPMLRIISWASAGVNPFIMGIGPMESTHKVFTQPKTKRAAGIEMDKMDIIEVHEAFAAQVLSVYKESARKYSRKWDLAKVNPYGGSLAFTHPLGATNFRLIGDILSRFDADPSARYGLACGCAGGGQGTTFVFERYR